MRKRANAALLAIAVLATTVLAATAAHAAPRCDVAEHDLLGSWKTGNGATQFEVFELARDGDATRFNEWLHQRPGITGARWSFDDTRCRLAIDSTTVPLPVFRVALSEGRLLLAPEDGGAPEAYHRVGD